MTDDFQENFDQARDHAAAKAQLRRVRVQSEDHLKQESHRLACLDEFMEAVEAEISRLEKPGLFTAIFSKPAEKLGERREEHRVAQREHQEVAEVIDSITGKLADIDRQLDELGDADAQYAAAIEARQRAILERGDESSDQLRELSDGLNAAKLRMRTAETALDEAKAVMHRITTMNNSVDRARKSRVVGRSAPVLGTAWNVVKGQIAAPTVSRVRDALERLNRRLHEMDLSAQTQADLDLIRVMPIFDMFIDQLTRGWVHGAMTDLAAAHPIQEAVQTAISSLRGKFDDSKKQVADLERQKHVFIEST